MEVVEFKSFKVSRWIFLSLVIVFNGFVIAYSRFSKDTANRFNNLVTNIFVGIVNNITKKEVGVILITELLVALLVIYTLITIRLIIYIDILYKLKLLFVYFNRWLYTRTTPTNKVIVNRAVHITSRY